MQKNPHSYICTEKGAIIKNIPIKKKLHVEQRKIIKIKKINYIHIQEHTTLQ